MVLANIVYLSPAYQRKIKMFYYGQLCMITGAAKNPEVVTFYNQTKSGVDVIDKLKSLAAYKFFQYFEHFLQKLSVLL